MYYNLQTSRGYVLLKIIQGTDFFVKNTILPTKLASNDVQNRLVK